MTWFVMTIYDSDNEVIMDYLGFTRDGNHYEFDTSSICEIHDRVKIADSLGYEWSVSEQDDFEDEEVGYYNEIEAWFDRYGEE